MTVQGAFGVVLKITVTAALTAVAHITDVEFPELEKVLAEITAHDSPGGWAEFIDSGKRMANEFTCTLVWDVSDTTHSAIVAAFDGTAAVEMSIEDPAGSEVLTFDAFISKISRIAEQEEGYKAEVTIQPTGAVVITP